ncbi:MAG: hypothetical protein MK212_01465, partial [Saprospiraceae bacterium]|nr:hypothetical protein [Saprospiraceae bacterium]
MLKAQLSVISSGSPDAIKVCQSSESVEITLIANSTVVGSAIHVYLPQGVYYNENSVQILQNPSNIQITESNLSDLRQPEFSFTGTLNTADTLVFQITRQADCSALAFRNTGGSLIDSVYAYYNNGQISNNLSTLNVSVIPFSIQEAIVSIGGTAANGGIEDLTAQVGDTVQRTLIITNGGLGCTNTIDFYIVDEGSSIEILQLDFLTTSAQGTANLPFTLTPHHTSGDTSFYTLDMDNLGGVGSYLCNGETITLQETTRVLSCISNSNDGTSHYGVSWSCGGACQPLLTASANISNPLNVPDIEIVDLNWNENPNSFQGQTFLKRFRIRNVGSADAFNLDFQISIRDSNSSITLFTNSPVSIFPNGTSTPQAFTPNQYTSRVIQASFTSLAAGEYIDLQVEVEHICPDENQCGVFRYDGYRRSQISYQDGCGNNFSLNSTNIDNNRTLRTYNFNEYNLPIIYNGQVAPFSTATGNISGLNTNSSLIWEIILPPCGVNFSGSASDVSWANRYPISLLTNGDTIRATFDVPNNDIYDNATLTINTMGSCGTCGAQQSIQKRLFVNTSATDPDHCKFCVYNISNSLSVDQSCNAAPCDGLRMTNFEFLRTNLGLADNDNDRYPDPTGTLDTSQIRRDFFIYRDTSQALFEGKIQVLQGSPNYNFAYIELTIDNNWDFLDGSAEILDASTGTVLYCNQLQLNNTTVNGNRKTFIFDYSPSSLSSPCPNVNNTYSFEDGDSITVRANFVNTLNGNNILDGLVYPVRMYTSEVANPSTAQQASCNNNIGFSALYKIYSLEPRVDISGNGLHNSCNLRRVDVEVEANTGQNIQSINIFPYEYRLIGYPQTMTLQIPQGYEYDYARLNSFPNIPNNTLIDPVDPNANPLVFEVGQIYQAGGIPQHPTQVIPIDGLDRKEVQVFLRPTCTIANMTPQVMHATLDWTHTLPQLQDPNGEVLDATRSENGLRWQKPAVQLSPISSTTAEGVTEQVEWIVRINNPTNTSDASNVFLGFRSPSGNINVLQVEHISSNGTVVSPTLLSQQANTFQFGDITQTEYHDFRITANYNQCMLDSVWIMAGWNCTGYPNALSLYPCDLDTLTLLVQPKQAILQVESSFDSTADAGCDTLTYSFLINSAGEASVFKPSIELQLPQGLHLVGDAVIEYPIGSTPRVFNTTTVGQLLVIDLDNADAQNTGSLSIQNDGLLGTRMTNLVEERQALVQLKFLTTCDFVSGTGFYLHPYGEAPCGSAAQGSGIPSYQAPIHFDTMSTDYTILSSLYLAAVPSCQQPTVTLEVELVADGTPNSSDTTYIILPPDIRYQGNLTCYQSQCPTFLFNELLMDNSTRLVFAFPQNWASGDTVRFDLDIGTSNFTGCSNSEVISIEHISTVSTPSCALDGSSCGISRVSVGQEFLSTGIYKPDITISNI